MKAIYLASLFVVSLMICGTVYAQRDMWTKPDLEAEKERANKMRQTGLACQEDLESMFKPAGYLYEVPPLTHVWVEAHCEEAKSFVKDVLPWLTELYEVMETYESDSIRPVGTIAITRCGLLGDWVLLKGYTLHACYWGNRGPKVMDGYYKDLRKAVRE